MAGFIVSAPLDVARGIVFVVLEMQCITTSFRIDRRHTIRMNVYIYIYVCMYM